MDTNLEDKYSNLKQDLRDLGSVVIAFSGGVDSTLLLAVGKEALGDDILAVTIDSPLHPLGMLEGAAEIAGGLEVDHVTVHIAELGNEGLVSNPAERCYLCKHDRFSRLVEMAAREGMSEVADGTQLDDTGDYRPGMEAAAELGVRSPLLEVGLTKPEIRELSRELSLPTWKSPASTCLATRIPYGQRITREKLNIIERGEKFLGELGLTPLRLRYIDEATARIETSPACLVDLVTAGIRELVISEMKNLGFVYVTVDLVGFRSGALNEILPES